MVWVEESDHDLAFLLLEFGKEFDIINQWLLFLILEALMDKMGINIILGHHLHKNGKLGQPLCLSRSMRQGCPLSPYLFCLFMS